MHNTVNFKEISTCLLELILANIQVSIIVVYMLLYFYTVKGRFFFTLTYFLLYILINSCNEKPNYLIDNYRVERNDKFSKIADSLVNLLKDGDIITRKGYDMTSHVMAQLNPTYHDYSHCGIVFFENNKPVVYHALGSEDNPQLTLMRADPIGFFGVGDNERIGIFRFQSNKIDLNLYKQAVLDYYQQKPVFDFKFNNKNDDSLYCSEFVAKSINKAVQEQEKVQEDFLSGVPYFSLESILKHKDVEMIADCILK